jgi:hypothetical protein
MAIAPLSWVQSLILLGGGVTLVGVGLLLRSIYGAERTVPPQGHHTAIALSPPPWFTPNLSFPEGLTRFGRAQLSHPSEALPNGRLRWVGWSSGVGMGAAVTHLYLSHPNFPGASSLGWLMVGIAAGVGTGLVRSLLWLAARKPVKEAVFEVALPTAATLGITTLLWGVIALMGRFPPVPWGAAIAGLYIALGNGIAVTMLLGDRSWPLAPRRFRCDRCRTPVVPLTAPEVEALLTPAEAQARPLRYLHRPTLQIQGWRCPTCHPTLSRDTCYRVIYHQESALCPQCQQPTCLHRDNKVELGKLCHHCGYETPGFEDIDVATAKRRIQQDPVIQGELEQIRTLQAIQRQAQAKAADAKPEGDRDDDWDVNLGPLMDFSDLNDGSGD